MIKYTASDEHDRSTVLPTGYVRNGWLAPDGNIEYVDNDCGHDDTAARLVVKYGYADRPHEYDSASYLFERGWIELSANRSSYVYVGSVRRLTQQQQDALWDVYMDARAIPLPNYTIKNALDDLAKMLKITQSSAATVPDEDTW